MSEVTTHLKSKNLSFGGHITLIKTTLPNLPINFIFTFKIPKRIANSNHNKCNSFGEEIRSLSLILLSGISSLDEKKKTLLVWVAFLKEIKLL